MQLTKSKVYLSIALFMGILGTLFYIGINPLFIRSITAFLFFISVPGYLLMKMFRISAGNLFEQLSYIISTSIAYLIFIGLTINTIYPMFGNYRALEFNSVYFTLNTSLLCLIPLAYLRENNTNQTTLTLPRFSFNTLFSLFAFLFPIISSIGALLLNNGGSNSIAVLYIFSVILYVIMLTIFRKKIHSGTYPIIIYLLGLSLLLSYSLRSWYVLGWDINYEFNMFQLTKLNYLWSIDNAQSIYNTCLSITILPTMLNSILQVSDESIFKLFFQFLFAIVSMNIFLIARKYISPSLAFLASFFFISQQSFYMQLTSVVRQEIALIFFTSAILLLFNKNIHTIKKNIFFVVLNIAMIMSHYSTAYIAVVLYVVTYGFNIAYKFYSYLLDKRTNNKHKYYYNLNLVSLIVIFVFTIFWNSLSTSSFSTISNTLTTVFGSLHNTFSFNDRSSTILTFLFNKNYIYTENELDSYIAEKSYAVVKDHNLLYNNISQSYDLNLVKGLYPVRINSLQNTLILLPYSITKYSVLIGLVVGICYLCVHLLKSRNNLNMDYEFIFFSFSSFILMSLIVLVPHLSRAYNIDRLFQQSLTFASVVIIIGITVIFMKIKKNPQIIMLSIFLLYYLYQSGITASYTGDVIRINTNNSGPEYDAHYIHKQDVYGIKWLDQKTNNKFRIHTDMLTQPKLYSLGLSGDKSVPFIFPQVIGKGNYIYSGYTNNKRKIASIEDGIQNNYSYLYIDFPFKYLNENKDLIYSNGGAAIYK